MKTRKEGTETIRFPLFVDGESGVLGDLLTAVVEVEAAADQSAHDQKDNNPVVALHDRPEREEQDEVSHRESHGENDGQNNQPVEHVLQELLHGVASISIAW